MNRITGCFSGLAAILFLATITTSVLGFQEKLHGRRTSSEKSKEHQQLSKLIQENKLAAAEKLIDFHLRNNPLDLDIWMLRRNLANAYIRNQQRSKANVQFETLATFMMQNAQACRPILKHLPPVLISLPFVQRGEEPASSRLLVPAIAVLTSASADRPSNAAYSAGVSSAVNMLARAKMKNSKPQEAIAIYESELTRLRVRRDQATSNPNRWYLLAYNLKSAFDTIGDGYDSITVPWRNERENILRYGIQAFPKSRSLVDSYFGDRLFSIAEYEIMRPEQAATQYREAIRQIKAVMAKVPNKSTLMPLRIKIEKSDQKFRRRQARIKMIGGMAPRIRDVDWIHGEELAARQMAVDSKTPTVLYFFEPGKTSAVEGLITIHEAIQNVEATDVKILAIVPGQGLDFNWLASLKRDVKTTPEQQMAFRQRMLGKFIQDDAFRFPLGIARDPVSLADQFGITENPHAVIISDTGIVEDIRFGKNLASEIIEFLKK